MKKRALISVFNKEGILEFAAFLSGEGWEILSTGGTAKYLKENKIPVTDVSAVTGFPECLDGRVKTLHPAIHAGLLARRGDAKHMETLDQLKLAPIDLVCVNLYPFFEKAREAYGGRLTREETIEFIDIGGPSMLRSAAKNFRDVIVLSDPKDYASAAAGIAAGNLSPEMRKHLAGKVFALTSAYDAAIARYLMEADGAAGNAEVSAGNSSAETEYPEFLPLSFQKAQSLRYGENNHQSAALYFHTDKRGAMPGFEQLHGKELGYNNIRDMDIAWKAACAFGLSADGTEPLGESELMRQLPGAENAGASGGICCVAVKHNTPCGIALGNTLIEAYDKTFACDPVSIFGGIVAANAPVDALTAEKLGELFLEIVIAPDFEDDALKILKKKKNLRIVRAAHAPSDTREYSSVSGGLLVQAADRKLIEKWEVATKTAPAEEDLKDLIFGLRAVTFVKSNAIMIVKDLAASGIGGGQVNRIWPTTQALERSAGAIKTASEKGGPWKDGRPARVLASDAFFPFADCVEASAAAGIKAIIQPGGSINDKLSIEACDRLGLAMIFTGVRHFKH